MLERLALGLSLNSLHFFAVSASFPICQALSLQGQGWSEGGRTWGEEGQEEKEGSPPASFPPPGWAQDCSQDKAGHPFPPAGGCCAVVVQPVACGLFPTPPSPAKPETPSVKAQFFPLPWAPAYTSGLKFQRRHSYHNLKSVNTNGPNYTKGENLVQMLSRQERMLVGRGRASSSQNTLVMINMGTRSPDRRPSARLLHSWAEEQEGRGHPGCPGDALDVGHEGNATDVKVVITQRQGAVHLPQRRLGHHCRGLLPQKNTSPQP